MSENTYPQCPKCDRQMQLVKVHPNGGKSYFCACSPGGFWKNEHPISSAKSKEEVANELRNRAH